MKKLNNVTLVMQETMYHDLARRSLEYTLDRCEFAEVVTFSNQDILPGARNVKIEHFPLISDYCEFMLRGMLPHINTEFMLFQQWDAMVHDASAWQDQFLNYDYIGARWPWWPEGKNIGNGGFSLRSHRLLEALQNPMIQMQPENPHAEHEDQLIGMEYRIYLTHKYGICYPHSELARQFSYEVGEYIPSWGFHGPWNVIKFCDDATVEYFIQHMNYQSWNHFKWHHILFALIKRGRPDLVEQVTLKLNTHGTKHVDLVLKMLESNIFDNYIQ